MFVCALKIFGILVALVLGFVIAGLTGLLFWLWPTFWPDADLRISPLHLDELRQLRAERKFIEDWTIHYPGPQNEISRAAAEAKVNVLLDTLLAGLPSHKTKSFVLARFKSTLRGWDDIDSEDRDRLLGYLQQIMQILGVDSSNELLNVWRYGLPHGWVP
jgi:hypothetical protein